MHALTPLTQKAQGIVASKDGCLSISLCGPGTPLMVIPGSLWDCRISHIKWPMFARPCPFRPRHGFVDSRKVNSWEAVIELLQIAKESDPTRPVEVVLAPMLTGNVSAVATNAGITWGRGNDGVTAGKDPRALFIPVKTSKAAWCTTVNWMICDTLDFEIPMFPYLEIVEHEDDMCLVQVRDGPEQPEGVNHVIRKMKVRRVLRAYSSTSLLEWEDKVDEAAEQKGVVIWAPGMSLASHFCVHGIESGIPVITDHRVRIDDMLLPTKNRTSGLRKRDFAKVAALITDTISDDLKLGDMASQRNALLTAIATIQAQFCWGKEPHLLRLRGLSIALLLKAVIASCAGEVRYWTGPEGPRIGEPSMYAFLDGVDGCRNDRSRIYKTVFNGSFTFEKMERDLKAAAVDLGHEGWESSFGGYHWAEIASNGVALTQATKHFCDQPCVATWSKVVQKANRLINTSHNNGKCLTKWVAHLALKMISESPTAGFVNPYVTQVALKMTNEGDMT